jgi:putative two-component system response regulator
VVKRGSARSGANVLVVDDDDGIRKMLARVLDRHGHHCIVAGGVEEARARLNEEAFDLVITDVGMPGGSGLDLLMRIASDHPDVATIMISGLDDPKVAATALDMGAYGYIQKPFEANEILINVTNALRRRELEEENRNHRQRLEQMLKDRTQELMGYVSRLEVAEKDMIQLQEAMVQRLSKVAEFRDDEGPQHIERMSRYCSLIADRTGESPERCEMLRMASAMHDVGKIAVPDVILFKPGKLEPDEYERVKHHCDVGHRILSGTGSELMNTAATIALTHHEWVDGSGYPQGLKGEDIPIEGRMACIADVFDVLTSDRVYSKAMTFAEATQVMKAGRGIQFDETLLDVFLAAMGLILGIKERYADPVT